MQKSGMFMFLLVVTFPAVVMANEADLPEGESVAQEERLVNILGETQKQRDKVFVREMTIREVLLQRLKERHEAGFDLDISKEFIENLSDAEIEGLLNQPEKEEESFVVPIENDEGKSEKDYSEKDNQGVIDRIKNGILATMALLGGGSTIWFTYNNEAFETNRSTHKNTDEELEGNINAEMIWHFLKAEGFTDEGAAGVMGNIRQEAGTGFDPKKLQYGDDIDLEDNRQGVGIMQWSTKERKLGLIGKAVEMGLPWYDLTVQLAWMKEEASQKSDYIVEQQCLKEDEGQYCGVCRRYKEMSSWNACKTCDNYMDATYLWHDNYVMSQDYTNSNTNYSIDNRIRFAQRALYFFAKK